MNDGLHVPSNNGISASSSSEPPDNKNCFVVMPFGQTAEEERWFSGWYQAVIEPAIHSANYYPILSAAEDQPSAINDEIRAHLVFDAMTIVDLGGRTPEDPPNPNVMYELGIRHAFGLPVVLLAWEGQRLPFDVSNQRAILSRRDFLDIEPSRNRLAKFIHAAGQGKYYNPMEAVGREAAIDKTSLILGEESLLGALASEVRALRSTFIHGRSQTRPRWKRLKVRNALAGKQARSQLWQRVQEIGYDNSLWSKFLTLPVAEERLEVMKNWTIDEWIDYAKEKADDFTAPENLTIGSRTSQDILEVVRSELPQQPWPKGTHKVIADKLNLPVKDVTRAITELIRNGVFLNQVDGTLISNLDYNQEDIMPNEAIL